jgi:antitoxin ParD1/3/4
MRNSVSLKVTLPREMAESVKEKVAAGSYASESEVILEGLRALEAREAAVEDWLRTEGVARYDAYHEGETGTRPLAEVVERIRTRHTASPKTGQRSIRLS